MPIYHSAVKSRELAAFLCLLLRKSFLKYGKSAIFMQKYAEIFAYINKKQ